MSWIEYTSPINYPIGQINCRWECDKNKRIVQNDNLHSAWKHRSYLQNNGELIINQNTKNFMTDLPQIFNINTKKYSYNTTFQSDLKQDFLQKFQLNICPSIPTNL